jgi:hypothetical protein
MGHLGEAGGWNVRGRVNMGRVRVRSMVKDRKCEWEIDGKREEKKRQYEVDERWNNWASVQVGGTELQTEREEISQERASKTV